MNYAGKKIAVTGGDSFIGSAIVRELRNTYGENIEVNLLGGDVRNFATFGALNHSYDYLFHFGAPSSQIQFRRQPLYCAETTLIGFIHAAKMCAEYGVRLVYPSTGLLSSSQPLNEYARCKKVCEDIAKAEKIDSIGLRIFATYGPGEGHKRDFASVPYIFARDMVAGRAPVIYGDGKQERDFIYIDDVVQAILHLAEDGPTHAVVDVGSGVPVSFNDIISQLKDLAAGPAEAVYVEAPAGYVKETVADPGQMAEFYTQQVSFTEGIGRLVKHLREESNV